MEENCIGSQVPQRTVVLENKRTRARTRTRKGKEKEFDDGDEKVGPLKVGQYI
jgi:hypothetical protein